MKNGMITSLVCAVSLTAIVGLRTPAMADERPVLRSMNVSLGDLDLTTPQGLDAARERVHEVARGLCSKLSDRQDLSRQYNYVTCINQAMAGVVPQVVALARLKSSIKTAGIRRP